MNNEDNFYVGYGPLPDKDRRFLLKTVPAGLLGLAATGAILGGLAASAGGGRWETGTPVTLKGRMGFHPYPVLWVNGIGHVIAGFGKQSADSYCRPFEGQAVEITGIKITRNQCFMLGVADGDIAPINTIMPPLPKAVFKKNISVAGEVLDAQCFMGIMNPGYGRSHRGCAAQCIRGGQPVFFMMGFRGKDKAGIAHTCGGNGFLLANSDGGKINAEILGHIAVPVIIEARLKQIGNLYQLTYKDDSLGRL